MSDKFYDEFITAMFYIVAGLAALVLVITLAVIIWTLPIPMLFVFFTFIVVPALYAWYKIK